MLYVTENVIICQEINNGSYFGNIYALCVTYFVPAVAIIKKIIVLTEY